MGDRRLEEAGDEVNGAFFPRFSSEMKATRSTSSMSTCERPTTRAPRKSSSLKVQAPTYTTKVDREKGFQVRARKPEEATRKVSSEQDAIAAVSDIFHQKVGHHPTRRDRRYSATFDSEASPTSIRSIFNITASTAPQWHK